MKLFRSCNSASGRLPLTVKIPLMHGIVEYRCQNTLSFGSHVLKRAEDQKFSKDCGVMGEAIDERVEVADASIRVPRAVLLGLILQSC